MTQNVKQICVKIYRSENLSKNLQEEHIFGESFCHQIKMYDYDEIIIPSQTEDYQYILRKSKYCRHIIVKIEKIDPQNLTISLFGNETILFSGTGFEIVNLFLNLSNIKLPKNYYLCDLQGTSVTGLKCQDFVKLKINIREQHPDINCRITCFNENITHTSAGISMIAYSA